MKTRYVVLAMSLISSVLVPAFSLDDFQPYGAAAASYASGVKVLPGKAVYYSSGVTSNVKDGTTMK